MSPESILFVYPIIATILGLLIMLMVLVYKWRLGGKAKPLKIRGKSNILAVSIISITRQILFIVLDALAQATEYPCTDPKEKAICGLTPSPYRIPLALLFSDLFALLLSSVGIVTAIATCLLVRKFSPKFLNIQDFHYYLLALTFVGFILSCLMHSPYIAMAYLSDAHYATSVLVYYMTILFAEFGLIQHILKIHFQVRSRGKFQNFCTFLVIGLLIVVLYGLVLTISFYLYYLPIINLFSNLPNEGIVIYQTALVLVGAYVTYKTVLQTEPDQEKLHTTLAKKRKLKKIEISILKNELQLFDHGNNRQRASNLRERIAYLQHEIKLTLIQSKIVSVIEGPETPIKQMMINDLDRQEQQILTYLKDSRNRLSQQDQSSHSAHQLETTECAQPAQPLQSHKHGSLTLVQPGPILEAHPTQPLETSQSAQSAQQGQSQELDEPVLTAQLTQQTHVQVAQGGQPQVKDQQDYHMQSEYLEYLQNKTTRLQLVHRVNSEVDLDELEKELTKQLNRESESNVVGQGGQQKYSYTRLQETDEEKLLEESREPVLDTKSEEDESSM